MSLFHLTFPPIQGSLRAYRMISVRDLLVQLGTTRADRDYLWPRGCVSKPVVLSHICPVTIVWRRNSEASEQMRNLHTSTVSDYTALFFERSQLNPDNVNCTAQNRNAVQACHKLIRQENLTLLLISVVQGYNHSGQCVLRAVRTAKMLIT